MKWLVPLAWLSGLAFLWAFPALPFQDLPAHAGLVALRARLATSPIEASFIGSAPELGTYSVFRALGAAFGALFGPLAAVRLLATLVWAAWPAALAWARYRLFGERPPASTWLLGMLLVLGLLTLQGFASYQLATALVLVANAEWLVTLRTGRRGWIPAALALLLVAMHGVAFALFGVLAVAAWLHARRPRLAPLWLVPALSFAAWSMHSAWTTSWRFSTPLDKLLLLLSPTLLTRFGLDAAVSVLLWALAIRALRREPGVLRLQALLGFSLFLLLPSAVGPLGSLDARVLPVVLALALLSLRADRVLAAATFVVLGCGLSASLLFQREAEGTAIFRAVPPGSRLLHLPIDPDSAYFAAHPFLHYDKLALVDEPLVVSDLWFHQGTALTAKPSHPALRLPRSEYSVLRRVDWPAYRWEDWDYVLIRLKYGAPEAEGVPSRLVRIDHRGGFWLYRVGDPE